MVLFAGIFILLKASIDESNRSSVACGKKDRHGTSSRSVCVTKLMQGHEWEMHGSITVDIDVQ